MADNPCVSIIIRAFNEEIALPMTLHAIRSQDCVHPVEVIVVDSGSSDATRDIAEAHGARVVRLGREYRPGYAVNVGVAASAAPVCVLLSAPAFPVNEQWLDRLVAPLLADGGGPDVTFSRHFAMPDACPVEEGFLGSAFAATTSLALFSATSAAFRREVAERVAWNEDFGSGGGEDREWALRVRGRGFRIAYVPQSGIVRSHSLDACGWYRRVVNDSAVERVISAQFGEATRPAASGGRLALSTVERLLRRKEFAECIRFLGLAPLLMVARTSFGARIGPRGQAIVDALGAVDRRLFAPRLRWERAFSRFAKTYWAGAANPVAHGR